MTAALRPPRRGLAWAPLAAVLAACGHALYAGWGRWGDPFIDTGRELELPRRLLEGEALYSRLRFYYGPLAPHVNALLYRTFGVHLDVLAAAGAVTGVLTALVLYALTRRFTTRLGAAVAAVTFVYTCAFAALHPIAIFNWVVPYSYSATYGMLAALLSLLFLVRHAQGEGTRDLFLSVLFLAVAALAKAEPLLPALVAHALFLAAALAGGRAARVHALAYGAGGAAVASVYGALALRVGGGLWRDNLAAPVNAGSSHFVAEMMGLTDPGESLRYLGISLLLVAGAGGVGVLAAACLRAPTRSRPVRAVAVGAAGAATAALGFLVPIHLTFRVIPLLAALALAGLAVAWVRRPDRRDALLPHLLLWGFALAALGRVVLAAHPFRYGFYLLPAGLSALAVLAFEYLPARLGGGPWQARALAAGAAGLLLGTAAAAAGLSRARFEARTLALASPRGTLRVEGELSKFFPVLEAIARAPPGASLLVLPYGSALNFLMERPGTSDGMFSYLPMELAGAYDDAGLAARWRRDPPDLVLWVATGDEEEFGDARFGFTYAVRSGRWIQGAYRVIAQGRDGVAVLLAFDPGMAASARAVP